MHLPLARRQFHRAHQDGETCRDGRHAKPGIHKTSSTTNRL
jgi:hypothetical protein